VYVGKTVVTRSTGEKKGDEFGKFEVLLATRLARDGTKNVELRTTNASRTSHYSINRSNGLIVILIG
jgi:hypothetical protein